MRSPRGSIVRTMRLTETTVAADGTERKLTLAGGGVIVRVKPDSDSRKKFRSYVIAFGIVATPCEENGNADGTYNRRTGVQENDPAATVTAWQCIGPGPALAALVGMDDEGRRSAPKSFVADWHFAVSVRVPVGAQGSGPEKVRPPMGSAYGKPAQVKATAEALQSDRMRRLLAEIKAGRI